MKQQRDMMLNEDGGFTLTTDPDESRKFYTSSFKLAPIIGFGFWRDVYNEKLIGIGGISNNLILPFIRIQWGFLLKPKID